MADEGIPLNPRAYFRSRVESLRREVEQIRGRGASKPGDHFRLARAERELQLAESDLEAVEPTRRRDDE